MVIRVFVYIHVHIHVCVCMFLSPCRNPAAPRRGLEVGHGAPRHAQSNLVALGRIRPIRPQICRNLRRSGRFRATSGSKLDQRWAHSARVVTSSTNLGYTSAKFRPDSGKFWRCRPDLSRRSAWIEIRPRPHPLFASLRASESQKLH